MRVARGVVVLWAVVLVLALVGEGRRVGADGPVLFHCAFDASCPEVMVAGDPYATIGGNPAPYRGYGDPSLEYDSSTGTLWMTYSWLDVLVADPGPPTVVDFGVRTHLARSDDGGQTFTYVRAVNATPAVQHPDTSEDGWMIREVSTIAKRGNDWEALSFDYFDPVGAPSPGTDHRRDWFYSRTLAATPPGLGDTVGPWAHGYATSASFGALHNLSAEIPEVSDCAVFTEPALLASGGDTYLATACIVVVNGVRRFDLERTVLLRENGGSYEYIGALLDDGDAVDNGGTRIEQVDLSIAENGAILLIGTPILDTTGAYHLGCVVFEVADIATAQVRRTTSGEAVALMRITGDDTSVGAGLCTYDAASATGVLMVLHDYTASPFEMVFSMRATGQHPQGLDTDADGRADTADNCPGWPNAGQQPPEWPAPPGDDDCDGFTAASETFVGSDPADHCAADPVRDNEAGPDAWPADFDDNQMANTLDLVVYVTALNTAMGDPNYVQRADLNANGTITTLDLVAYVAMLNKTCMP